MYSACRVLPQSLHDEIKLFRSPVIPVPKHVKPGWQWAADDASISARAAQLQDYINVVVGLANTVPPRESNAAFQTWQYFRRAVDCFFETDFIPRTTRFNFRNAHHSTNIMK
jgi:hypothetical protein